MIMTDPPYNVAIEGGGKERLRIENDDMEDAEFKAFLVKAFRNMERYLKPGGSFYIWHATKSVDAFMMACQMSGLTVKQVLIWVKQHFTLGRQDYQWMHEPCLYGWKEGAAHWFIPIRTLKTVQEEPLDIDGMSKDELREVLRKMLSEVPTDVLRADKPVRNADHPTMKPIKLIAGLLHNSSLIGQSVLDPFGGSGSTLIACEQLNRKCITMEYDPRYCDVIIERWEALTGGKAELIDAREHAQQEGAPPEQAPTYSNIVGSS